MLTIEQALEAIESEIGILPPMGAQRLSKDSRYRQVLQAIKNKICPEKKRIQKLIKSKKADLTTSISDIFLSWIIGCPAPIATISRQIADVGLDVFCKNPNSVIY